MTVVPALRIATNDDVAVVTQTVAAGDAVLGVAVLDPIPSGHKLALRDLAVGEPVRKYGQVIGQASRFIPAGAHVHSHNLTVSGCAATPSTSLPPSPACPVARPCPERTTFDGYLRADGQVGTRNVIGIIASVNCAATAVRRIARKFERDLPGSIDAVAPFTHSSGCGMAKSGDGFEVLERTLAGYARHPNFGGMLMLGWDAKSPKSTSCWTVTA
nr:UxaA family hydrolase [Sphingobium abikonense]